MIMTVVLVFLYYSLTNQQLVSNKTILNQKHNQYHNPAGVDYGAPTWKLTKKSAYYNVQVGVAPTWRISKRNSTDNASWAGPQHRS
ncbi:nitrogen regulation protein NIFR3 [Staphylococcus aureus]|nr:nitrogen regulation protein NIFR3 [Staphylococcus aureus]